jgi:hypothetical protein
MAKTYGVIDPITGTLITFEARGYREAKRYLARIRRTRDDLGAPRWMTAKERAYYARCFE